MKLVNIGFGNLVNTAKIVAVVSPESAPIKRIITEAKKDNLLIDATQGRKTKSVIVTDSGQIVLSYQTNEVLAEKLEEEKEG